MPPQGSRRRTGSEDGDGDGVDRISSLPDELLLEILGRLFDLPEAVRSTILSRCWYRLWNMLSKLDFSDIDPGLVETMLAQVTSPVVHCLNFSFDTPLSLHRTFSPLHAAALLHLESFSISTDVNSDGDNVISLPCYDRTVFLRIDIENEWLAPPWSGQFTMLKNLSIVRGWIDPASMLPMFPLLRVLEIYDCLSLDIVKVHSESLEVLSLQTANVETIHRIDIDAPVLKDMKVRIIMDYDFTISFSAPAVKNLDWRCYGKAWFDGLWGLDSIYERKHHACYVLSLTIFCHCLSPHYDAHGAWSFVQKIESLPATNYSILELDLETEGHA
ncbi:unnamed protein product [Urochloa decumbens]|uniref:F-box domain-containing protein n=1 Tax=Urochloa decumbens TaxID=240449 RepID=A0ABC8YWK1_9POAL